VPTFIALLRGINVGGKRSILMADLRATFETAKATGVTTYIQSGNVVFRHAARSARSLAATLEKAIAKASGFAVPVILRTAAEWSAIIENNPFPAEPAHLHLACLASAPPPDALAALAPASYAPERVALVGRELYLWLPQGLGNSKLASAALKLKPLAAATARNWRTVLHLQALAAK